MNKYPTVNITSKQLNESFEQKVTPEERENVSQAVANSEAFKIRVMPDVDMITALFGEGAPKILAATAFSMGVYHGYRIGVTVDNQNTKQEEVQTGA